MRENKGTKRLFGKLPTGEQVFIYKICDGRFVAEIMEYGASIVSLRPFGRTDVVGGFDLLDKYLEDMSNQGAIVGRVANRIANAKFEMNGNEYILPNNDNGNCLHGGIGFQHRAWRVSEHTKNSITLTYLSESGEDGFPSDLAVKVTYTIQNSALIINYEAVPSDYTPICLTNHAFFNLDGFGNDIKEHSIQIWAKQYSETDKNLIPTGHRPFVEGTKLDLREPRKIGEAFSEDFSGYDHNMILSPVIFKSFAFNRLGLVARASNQKISMQMYTDQPCLQFYTGNFLGDGPAFKREIPQIRHGAFCLEAQTEPNCINHGEAIYHKGDIYRQITVYEFLKNSMI